MTGWVPERSYSMDGQKIFVAMIWLGFSVLFLIVGSQPDEASMKVLWFLVAAASVVAADLSTRVRLDVCSRGLVAVRGLRARRLVWSEIERFEVVSSNFSGGLCLGIRLEDGRLLRSRGIAHLSPRKVEPAIIELDQDLGRGRSGSGVGDGTRQA